MYNLFFPSKLYFILFLNFINLSIVKFLHKCFFTLNIFYFTSSTFIFYFSQSIGHISGAHINPSITVAALILGKKSLSMSILYIIAQCIGGMLGYGLLKVKCYIKEQCFNILFSKFIIFLLFIFYLCSCIIFIVYFNLSYFKIFL